MFNYNLRGVHTCTRLFTTEQYFPPEFDSYLGSVYQFNLNFQYNWYTGCNKNRTRDQTTQVHVSRRFRQKLMAVTHYSISIPPYIIL